MPATSPSMAKEPNSPGSSTSCWSELYSRGSKAVRDKLHWVLINLCEIKELLKIRVIDVKQMQFDEDKGKEFRLGTSFASR